MRYRSIVFLDHEESDTDDGIEQDTALRILHHKTDDSVLWEMPTEESVDAAFDYLSQWDCGEGEITDYPPGGSADWTQTVWRDDRVFQITYNVGLSTISLDELMED